MTKREREQAQRAIEEHIASLQTAIEFHLSEHPALYKSAYEQVEKLGKWLTRQVREQYESDSV